MPEGKQLLRCRLTILEASEIAGICSEADEVVLAHSVLHPQNETC